MRTHPDYMRFPLEKEIPLMTLRDNLLIEKSDTI